MFTFFKNLINLALLIYKSEDKKINALTVNEDSHAFFIQDTPDWMLLFRAANRKISQMQVSLSALTPNWQTFIAYLLSAAINR